MLTADSVPSTPPPADSAAASPATRTNSPPRFQPEEIKPYPGKAGDGRYQKGNPGGPGNPYARRTAALRHAILDAVSDDQIRTLVGKLLQLALEGDKAAAKLVLSYAVGKPAAAVNPDTLDVQEWALFRQETAATDDEAGAVFEGLPAAGLCELARAAVPIRHFYLRQEAITTLRPDPEKEKQEQERKERKKKRQKERDLARGGLPPKPLNAEEVLRELREQHARRRSRPTRTPSPAPVTPPVAAGSGSNPNGAAVAPVAQQTTAAPPQVPPPSAPREEVAAGTAPREPAAPAQGNGFLARASGLACVVVCLVTFALALTGGACSRGLAAADGAGPSTRTVAVEQPSSPDSPQPTRADVPRREEDARKNGSVNSSPTSAAVARLSESGEQPTRLGESGYGWAPSVTKRWKRSRGTD